MVERNGERKQTGFVVEYYQVYSSCIFTVLFCSLFSVLFVSTSVAVKSENKIPRKQERAIVWPQSPCAIRMSYGKDIPS